jgi:hypothetical protein
MSIWPVLFHQVPITTPEMFSNPYSEIPIDTNDSRGAEPLITGRLTLLVVRGDWQK